MLNHSERRDGVRTGLSCASCLPWLPPLLFLLLGRLQDVLAVWRKGTEREKERTIAGEDVVKEWTFETRKAEKDRKNIDRSKYGGDKFYSQTKDSEAVSSGYDLSEEWLIGGRELNLGGGTYGEAAVAAP
ncbi:hypothetical protein NDU88_006651 [Pleurodeles waltl]|uniref:Uncharacterized protein n=1 Tax=Pleurodeles waltl TaxID=8319 RepID=A0AAV7WG90_PLEWA|nr:hypothetical protein NDU88_006651 [Pleurodeles waltl]